MSQRDSHQPASRSAILPLTTPLHQSWACRSRGRLVKHLPLLSWCLTSDDCRGMQKLTGTNYVWEAGRLESRSTNVEEEKEISRHMPERRNGCVCGAESLHAASSLSPLSSRMSCVHTRAISHEAWSLKEYIVLYTSALAEQFTTTHSFIRGGCCPHRSHYQSGQAAARVNLPGEESQHLCFEGFSLRV